MGGQARQQIFMLNLASPATDRWTVTGVDVSPSCNTSNPQLSIRVATDAVLRPAAWSPDDSTIYVATTGYHPNGTPVGSFTPDRAV